MLPGTRIIIDITRAQKASITFSENHSYTVGDVLYIRVPFDFGMTEIDSKEVKIISVSQPSVTVDIDSTNFTNFTIPANPETNSFAAMAGKRGLYDDWFLRYRKLIPLNPYRE